MKFSMNASEKIEHARYEKFRGVDFSTNPALCDRSRSPFAPNLISDAGGMPEKRAGWRTLLKLEAPINGIFHDEIDGEDIYLAHGGTKLYKWTVANAPPTVVLPIDDASWASEGSFEIIRENICNAPSTSFSLAGKMYIMTGEQILCYGKFEVEDTGENDKPKTTAQAELRDILEDAYVPCTSISRDSAGGGVHYENVNLLTGKRKNSFLCDGTAKTYQLDCENIDSAGVEIELAGACVAAADYSVDAKKGTITFKATAPPKPEVTGRDNMVVSFCKTNAENAEKICKCTIAVTYAGHAFVAGNTKAIDTDYRSGFLDASYFPDLGYTKVGSGGAIMGYAKIGEFLAIIKEDSDEQSTIFLRQEAAINGEVVFPVKQGVSGAGAISKYSFGNILGEPLFLSRKGVLGISSNNITAEKAVQNRSYYIDAQLLREPNLDRAVSCSYGGYYILAAGDKCYLLDGKQQKSYRAESMGDYVYECYVWENIHARTFLETRGNLYFGTQDGRICRLNTDMETMAKYSDDGAAIVCAWSTKADDDDSFMQYKTMRRHGCGVMIKPYLRSSVRVNVRTNKDFGQEIRYATMDVFDWVDLDFSRISFDSNDAPQVVPFNRKIKKYITLQITVRNDGANEGFGVYGINKAFSRGVVVR